MTDEHPCIRVCPACGGDGEADDEIECECCDGRGYHSVGTPCGSAEIPCERCRSGYVTVHNVKCKSCDGEGYVFRHRWQEQTGTQMTLSGESSAPRLYCLRCHETEVRFGRMFRPRAGGEVIN